MISKTVQNINYTLLFWIQIQFFFEKLFIVSDLRLENANPILPC